MTDRDMKQAADVYKTVCTALDGLHVKYDRDDENFNIVTSGVGDDLPIEIRMIVHPENCVISVLSQMPFRVPENKRKELALAVSMINYAMVDGSFDYNYLDGTIIFRLTYNYRDSLIGPELIKYMFSMSVTMADEFNDKLLKISLGAMTLDELKAALGK